MIEREKIEAMLRGDASMPPCLRVPLVAASAIPRVGMALRRARGEAHVNARVVSFGNLTLGGTGKTPAVIERAEQAVAAGRKVAVVTRGYASEPTEEPLVLPPGRIASVPSPEAAAVARRFGDEAALIAWRVPGCAIVKGRDRVAAARRAIAELGCDTILLDDGFQSVQLARDENVLVIDATCPFGNGRVQPAGYMREPLSAARRATNVLLTHCDMARDLAAVERLVRTICPGIPVRRTWHAPTSLVRLVDGTEMPLEDLCGTKVRPICAVGNPESFVRTLRGLGASIEEPIFLADHGLIEPSRLQEGPMLVMTEKDAVKLDTLPRGAHVLRIALRDWESMGRRV